MSYFFEVADVARPSDPATHLAAEQRYDRVEIEVAAVLQYPYEIRRESERRFAIVPERPDESTMQLVARILEDLDLTISA